MGLPKDPVQSPQISFEDLADHPVEFHRTAPSFSLLPPAGIGPFEKIEDQTVQFLRHIRHNSQIILPVTDFFREYLHREPEIFLPVQADDEIRISDVAAKIHHPGQETPAAPHRSDALPDGRAGMPEGHFPVPPVLDYQFIMRLLIKHRLHRHFSRSGLLFLPQEPDLFRFFPAGNLKTGRIFLRPPHSRPGIQGPALHRHRHLGCLDKDQFLTASMK